MSKRKKLLSGKTDNILRRLETVKIFSIDSEPISAKLEKMCRDINSRPKDPKRKLPIRG